MFSDCDATCIVTSSIRVRDVIQRIALHAGYASYFDARDTWWCVYYDDSRRALEPILHSARDIIRHTRTDASIRIWCPTIEPHNTMIVRRIVAVTSDAKGKGDQGRGQRVTEASLPIVIGNCRSCGGECREKN